MRMFFKSKDGGPESHVTGYFLIESKALFSIVLLRFAEGSREAFHSHAFNAWTLWLKGRVIEIIKTRRSEKLKLWRAGRLKFTPKNLMHRVLPFGTAWALSFRGPWKNYWREFLPATREFVTLTHGRKIVARLPE